MGSCFQYNDTKKKEISLQCWVIFAHQNLKRGRKDQEAGCTKEKEGTLKAYFAIPTYGKRIHTTGILLQCYKRNMIVRLGLELCFEHLQQKNNMHNKRHDVAILHTWQNTVNFFLQSYPPHAARSLINHNDTLRLACLIKQHRLLTEGALQGLSMRTHTQTNRHIPTAHNHVSLKMTCSGYRVSNFSHSFKCHKSTFCCCGLLDTMMGCRMKNDSHFLRDGIFLLSFSPLPELHAALQWLWVTRWHIISIH